MAVIQVKKYKCVKDQNKNKVQVSKTKEEWNKETRNGTMTWYFATRYKIDNISKLYKSKLFALKREAEEQERMFLSNPIEYIKINSKKAKLGIATIQLEINEDNKILNEYFKDFLENEINYIKPGGVYNNNIIWLNHISKTIGNLTPKTLTLQHVQNWHELSNKKINPKTNRLYATKTKNTWHSVLSEFLQYLYNKGLIPFNYARIIGYFKNPNVNKNERPKIKYQKIEEFNLFMSVVDDDFWYKFFNFLFWHGPRKGEQRAIKITDIDLKHDTVTFNKTFARNKNGGETIGPIKNGKIRTIFLAKQSKPYIEQLINFYKQMPGYCDKWFLFGGPHNTYKNRIEDKLNYYYDKLEEKYPDKKINRLTHHEFGRHSHASYLLNIGQGKQDIYALIATRLGDTEEVIRKTYAHPYEDENNDKVRELLNKIS